jgi:hypothetical protein
MVSVTPKELLPMNAMIRVSSVCLVLCAVFLAGCGNKTKTEARPAKDNKKPVETEHAKGPHGGHLFDVGPGHEYMGELVLTKEPRQLELYLLDHHDKKKAVVSGSKAITITAIKHDGKSLPAITLEAKPLESDKDGSSHFVASGDKLPNELDDVDALNGAKFKVDIGGKPIEATISAEHED